MSMTKPITGRTVLFAMLAFFGVIFAVNGSFTYFALSSFPGLTTEQAYEEGLSFNQTLENVAKQNAIGWISAVQLTQGGQVTIEIADRDGKALSGLNVQTVLMRPLDNESDQTLSLKEIRPGNYQTTGAQINPGQWRVELTASQNDNPVFYKIHNSVVE